MSDTLKILRLLSDPTRVRILTILREHQLSVAELQSILGMGQSRISTQLSQLRDGELVFSHRSGKSAIYETNTDLLGAELASLLAAAAAEIPEVEADRSALALAIRQRSDKARSYFNKLAGKFGRHYCPGRSWKGLAESLLKLMPPCVVADLGAGEGTFSQLLAGRAEKVIAVDISEEMVAYGTRVAKENGFTNLEYRIGDIETPPIDDAEVDIAFLSQALHHANRPQAAIDAAFRIVKPGGRIVILDLLRHQFEEARELYADVWLGFTEVEIYDLLHKAGFTDIDVAVVDREEEAPHFQTLLAIAERPTT